MENGEKEKDLVVRAWGVCYSRFLRSVAPLLVLFDTVFPQDIKDKVAHLFPREAHFFLHPHHRHRDGGGGDDGSPCTSRSKRRHGVGCGTPSTVSRPF